MILISALLWHRLMGKGVLAIDIGGSSYLRAYAHCTKGKEGISVLLINLSKSTRFSVSVLHVLHADGGGNRKDDDDDDDDDVDSIKAAREFGIREEYHLTAKDGNHLSQTVLLNGTPLELTLEGGIPPLNPVNVAAKLPINVAPLSIAFVVFPNFDAKACLR